MSLRAKLFPAKYGPTLPWWDDVDEVLDVPSKWEVNDEMTRINDAVRRNTALTEDGHLSEDRHHELTLALHDRWNVLSVVFDLSPSAFAAWKDGAPLEWALAFDRQAV